MNWRLGFLILIAPLQAFCLTSTTWVLTSSTLVWHVDHALHHSEGKSEGGKGKVVCKDTNCDLLVAVPVKSFDSGNQNRDAHALKIIRGELHPMAVVRASQFNVSDLQKGSIALPVTVELAGETVHLKSVTFKVTMPQNNSAQISGRLDLTFGEFKIDRPSLLGVPVSNDFYVLVDTKWHN